MATRKTHFLSYHGKMALTPKRFKEEIWKLLTQTKQNWLNLMAYSKSLSDRRKCPTGISRINFGSLLHLASKPFVIEQNDLQ